MKKINKTVAAALALATVITAASCSSSNGGGRQTDAPANNNEAQNTTAATTTTPLETNDTDAAVQELASNIEVDTSINPEKKLKWLAWWPIDETSAEAELFKANYGIPEEGSQEYGAEYADKISVYTSVAYQDRYDKLGQMVSSGDSPDIFPFEIGYFPLSAYKGMFQSVDGIIDTYSEEWADTREVMDKFMWGGKNYTPIVKEGTSYLWYYRKSILEEAGLPDPYELYKSGEWTWDALLDMADKFQQTGENKYLCDGWYISRSILCTTGTPLVGMENGQLVNNLKNSNVERAMEVISKLAAQNYGYPKVENGWSVNEKMWCNGDILFFVDGTWFYQGNGHKYAEKFGWGYDDVFFVPAPKDPKADAYYQEMKVDPIMFVAGSTNVDSYKAWIQCNLIASKDPEVNAAAREKLMRDEKWTAEQRDFIEELESGTVLTGVYDFRNGISTACANSDGSSPTDKLINDPYNSTDNTYAGLRSEFEGEIGAAIDELNASVS